ncbi:MAG: cyclopropane-fatty-acyl-phospholipid synthase family protein [Candidatus Pacebacteria bacterium]|nr:cyclopropane-fatty-acyl-phospholipid synthase family protein [Candidatus Paceibacterota bacterium]
MLTRIILRSLIRHGNLTFILPNGKSENCGKGQGAEIIVKIHSRKALLAILLNPRLRLGEAWMSGDLTLEKGSLYDLMTLLSINGNLPRQGIDSVMSSINFIRRRTGQINPIKRSKSNVAHHYDLSNEFYRLWLDEDMQYSCAYFREASVGLAQAQQDKKAHIAHKLRLQPGMRVLDIGCGWGGMAMTLARDFGVQVLGVTLSEQQLKLAQSRAEQAGLSHLVRFELRDYRHLAEQFAGKFDRIVSVGMFEHVGLPHYPEFFDHLRQLLTADGIALLHTIGRNDGPGYTNAWIRKYIFPGGYSPALSEVTQVIEQSGLHMTDVEVLRLHYAYTLRHWHENFVKVRRQVQEQFDDSFIRMWEFYLIGSEMAFRHGGHVVYQFQLSKQLDAVPLTRDYIYKTAEPVRAFESNRKAG